MTMMHKLCIGIILLDPGLPSSPAQRIDTLNHNIIKHFSNIPFYPIQNDIVYWI